MIKIIIADDQVNFSEALKYIIEKSGEIKVLGCASDGCEALELCKNHNPDLVLMDLQMPKCDGVEGTRLVKNYRSKIKVLILTTFNDDLDILRALQNGADGYVLKEIETMELVNIIRSTINGLGVMQTAILQRVSKMLPQVKSQDYFKTLESMGIGSRELDIIGYVVDGLSNLEIAQKMGYSEGTVKNLMTGILSKTGAKDRTQLAVYAVKNKLV
ncbi:MAG: response regulator transcription factor [Bacillota bacterium]|nr:response regulator transcription factor [Bacillota bacterium]